MTSGLEKFPDFNVPEFVFLVAESDYGKNVWHPGF